LSDEEADAARSDSYKHMGMYYDIVGLSNPAQASRKPASYGVETIARTLEGTSYDAAATLALNLPPNVRGAVFQGQTLGQPFIVLWAQTAGNSETVSLGYNLPSPVKLRVRDWQWSQTKTDQTLFPVNGQVSLTLSAIPLILIPQLAPPTLSQTFKPFAVGPGDSVTLEFTLSNPNLYASLTGLSFSTNLPAPLKIASPAGTSNNCGNGLVTAVADGISFSLSGLTLTPKQSCRVGVKVSSPMLGNFSTQAVTIAADVGPGVASNTTSLSVVTPQVVTTISDSLVAGQLTLRQAIANAVGPNGGVVNFSPALGPNPQINLATPLVVSPKTVIWNASCTNRVRLNANFAKVLQLGGNTYIRGLEIVTTLGPGINAVSNGNQLECTSVKS